MPTACVTFLLTRAVVRIGEYSVPAHLALAEVLPPVEGDVRVRYTCHSRRWR